MLHHLHPKILEMRWQNYFQMGCLIPSQWPFLGNGITTLGGTRVHQALAHLNAPSTDLEAWIEGYASEISHWPHFGFRPDRILIPPAIMMALFSAEVIHSHYWWTFSFTDHNNIDPVTAHAESPCWGMSAQTVTPCAQLSVLGKHEANSLCYRTSGPVSPP